MFERSGSNLVMSHTLSLTEALCGFQFVVPHLDGRNLVISRPPGSVVASGNQNSCVKLGMVCHTADGTDATRTRLIYVIHNNSNKIR